MYLRKTQAKSITAVTVWETRSRLFRGNTVESAAFESEAEDHRKLWPFWAEIKKKYREAI